MIIYKITNQINGKIYIGQTVQPLIKRWQNHLSTSSGCLALKAAIEKYGRENFKIEEIQSTNTLDELNKAEEYWVDKLNTLAPNGYNLKTGGDNSIPSKETRLKMSKASKGQIPWNKGLTKKDPRVAKYVRYGKETSAYGKVSPMKGKKHTEEAKRKMSESQMGRKHSNKTKQKMSEAHKGRVKTKAHRLNLSKSLKNKPKSRSHRKKISDMNKKQIKCVENNIIYSCAKDAAVNLNISVNSIYKVVYGKRKSVKGFTFVHVDGK